MREINAITKITIVFLFFAVLLTIMYLIGKAILHGKQKKWKPMIIKIICTVICFIVIIPFSRYAPPFNRTVPIKLIGAIELDYTSNDYWYCEFESHEPIDFQRRTGKFDRSLFEANGIELDTDRYTYLISVGYEIEELNYNVWDIGSRYYPVIDFWTDIVFGTVVRSETRSESTVYIYRLPKMRIDNIEGTKFE